MLIVLLTRPDWCTLEDQRDITAAAVVVAASGAGAVVASGVSQLLPFEPPQQEERTSPADDCGSQNVEPSPLVLCHRLTPLPAAPQAGPGSSS